MFRPLLAILLVITTASAACSQADCVLKKEGDDIRVYSCPSANSKIKAVRSTFNVDVPLSQLVAFVMDVDHYCEWQYRTIVGQTIKKVSDQELVYYCEITAPFPVSNRDLVARMTVAQDATSKVVTIKATIVDGYVPVKSDVVRIPVSEVTWTLTPAGPSKVDVDYHLLIDPGGLVPAWVINIFSTQGPYESFRDLKTKIHDPKFDTKAVFIVD